jgi:hypothetical protein
VSSDNGTPVLVYQRDLFSRHIVSWEELPDELRERITDLLAVLIEATLNQESSLTQEVTIHE